MGAISLKCMADSRGLEVKLGRRLDRRREAKPAQSELLFGNTSRQGASVHVLLTAPDPKPEPLTSTLLLPGGQPVCPLTSSLGWEDGSTWAFHHCSAQWEVDGVQHFFPLRVITEPRPEVWVQHWHANWIVLQIGSLNVLISGPHLHSKMGVCCSHGPAAHSICCFCYACLEHTTCWGFQGCSTLSSLPCHPRVPFTVLWPPETLCRTEECRGLPWKSMILKGLVSISWFLQSRKDPTLSSGSGCTLPSHPLCFSSLTQLPNFALR